MFNPKFRFIVQNYVYTLMAVATAVFFVCLYNMSSRNFLLILNGIYIGQIVAIMTSFLPYFFYVVFTHDPYTRARQYAITTGLQHLGYILVVTYSVTARRYGGNGAVAVDWQLLLSRYIILLAGFLQLMAPDFGRPLMYGLNRKALWVGSIAGFFVAAGVIWLQFWPDAVLLERMQELLGLGD